MGLAGLIGAEGIPSKAETIQVTASGVRLPDLLCDVAGLAVGIEGKFADAAGAVTDVTSQVRRRLDENLCEVGVAILYPPDIKDADYPADALTTAELQAKFFSAGREGDWISLSGASALVKALRRAREQLITDDAITESALAMRACIEVFVRAVDSQPARRDELFAIVTAAGATHQTTLDEDARKAAVAISGLAVLTALILQDQLSRTDPAVPPLPTPADGKRRTALVQSWEKVLERDYEAVFRIALSVLSELVDSPPLDNALASALDTAAEISAKGIMGRHDLVGRVYHTLLADKKFLATYYTSISAAVMLVELALDPADWPDVDFAADAPDFSLRIGDFACGTGTLLSGALGAVMANHARARVGAHKAIDAPGLGQRLIEDLVYGYDVLAYAVQVCATAMLLGSPGTQVSRTHLFQAPFGGEEGYLGSLDLLDGSIGQLRAFGGQQLQEVAHGDLAATEEIGIPQLDLVIMNPPFTRSVGGSKLLGSLHGPAFDAARGRLRDLVKRPDVRGNLTAGLGTPFVEMAARSVVAGGRLALVLPKAVLTGEAWTNTRKILSDDFQLEYVIASHEAGQHNFSDSTSLSEVLLIARRQGADDDHSGKRTTWVNLSENPDGAIEALATVAAIRRVLPVAKAEELQLTGGLTGVVGEAFSRPSPCTAEPWRWATFKSELLSQVGVSLLSNQPIRLPRATADIAIPLRPLDDIGLFGRDVRDVHDAFEESATPQGFPAFWGHAADKIRSISQAPNFDLRPRTDPAPGRKRIGDSGTIWKGAGALMVAERLRLNTHRCTAVSVGTRALSNTWWSVHLEVDDEPEWAAATALWLNSTLGVISIIGLAEETEGSWIKIKKNKLPELGVLDLRELSHEQRKLLTDGWEAVKDEDLMPIAQAGKDPTRTQMDRVVCEVLGIPDEQLAAVRGVLSAEPRFDDDHGTRARRRAKRTAVEQTEATERLF